jgi:predicted transcriptional regulator
VRGATARSKYTHRYNAKPEAPMKTVKEEIRTLIDNLPDDATWDQVMYEVYVRQKIADGEKAIAEGRVVPHEEVKKRFSSR